MATEQSTFYHFSQRYLSEIPRIAYDLKKQGKDILQIVAKRRDGEQ